MSHLGKIAAAGFDVMIFDAELLIAALDDSGDLPGGKGMEYFETLLTEKYMELSPVLEADLAIVGIENPILIEVEEDGRWAMMDGHHRLAWAAVVGAPVPVVLVDMHVDIFTLDAIMCELEEFYDHRAQAS